MPQTQHTLSRSAWLAARAAHQARIDQLLGGHTTRRSHGIPHPVVDFLFKYYSFRPAKLRRWSPPTNTLLLDTAPDETDHPASFQAVGTHCQMVPPPTSRAAFIEWAFHYLQAISLREPLFHCHGLHEWAMLYRTDQPRHPSVPLRLSPATIAHTVESLPLVCTHFDAYRFFTPDALPLNRHTLSRADTIDHDQPGCIHVTMDLYKFAYKLAPWTPSSLLADCFELALAAREIDMRASPYDLSRWQLTPIPIESPHGRAEYAAAQRQLLEAAQPLRAALLALYEHHHLNPTVSGRKGPDTGCQEAAWSEPGMGNSAGRDSNG